MKNKHGARYSINKNLISKFQETDLQDKNRCRTDPTDVVVVRYVLYI